MNTTAQQAWKLMWRYLRRQRGRALLLLVLLLAGIGLQLLAPQVIRRFLDAAQAGAALSVLVGTAVIYLITVTAQQGLGLATTYLGETVGWSATNLLRADLVSHVLRLDMGFHKVHTPGELIDRIDGDASQLGNYFSELVIQIFGNGLLMLGILVLLFWEDWRAGLIGLAYALLVLLFLRLMQARMVGIWTRMRQAYATMYGFLEERLAGMEDIRANGGEAYVLHRFYPLQRAQVDGRNRGDLLNSFTYSTSYFLYIVALAAILGLGAVLYVRGQISIGTVYLLVAYIGLMEAPITEIQRQIADLQQAFASIGRITTLFNVQTHVDARADVPQRARLPEGALAVTFDNVVFTYRDRAYALDGQAGGEQEPEETAVLHNLTFSLPAGRVLGVLGRTGSGKTTLTRLLFRLYDVDGGAIRLGGVDLRDIGLDDLRNHVGLVTQDVQIFAASVRENLTFFRRGIGDAQIVAALEQLGLHDWMRGLPQGLDTPLASGGKGLSAGEAQLLAFTRVFLQNPGLVVLDEASSRLDPTTEQLLERAVDRLLTRRTGIIIAHRLKTVQRADDILVLENGRIIEHGPRARLAADPSSRFHHLLQTGLSEALA